jgi:hypothetical protein
VHGGRKERKKRKEKGVRRGGGGTAIEEAGGGGREPSFTHLNKVHGPGHVSLDFMLYCIFCEKQKVLYEPQHPITPRKTDKEEEGGTHPFAHYFPSYIQKNPLQLMYL